MFFLLVVFFGAVHQSYAAWALLKSHPQCDAPSLRCHLTHSFCAVKEGGIGRGKEGLGNHRNHSVVTLLSGLLTALFFSYANSDAGF